MTRPLSEADRHAGFLRATGGFSRAKERWAERAARGLSDAELSDALAFELGIFGGSGGPGTLDLTFQAAGLKIWISWGVHNHVTMKPTFAGKSTITMARLAYAIKDPTERQLAFL